MLHFSKSLFMVFLKYSSRSFIYFIYTDSNSIKFIFNSYIKQIEEFIYPALNETCCNGLHLEYDCLRLSCVCRLVNPQYYFFPVVSVFILCSSEGIHFTTLNVRLCKTVMVIQNTYYSNCKKINVFPFGNNVFSTKTQYRVIHKSLRDFRTRLRNNQDRHGRKEHMHR